jgi:methylenetetrahydrofolate dehydrogenase (NADP+)/methenyltetrahydrofolate cyclohydrolase
MPATLMDGEAAAADVLADVARDAAAFGPVGFATIVVSDDPVEHGYALRKHEAARAAGIEPHDHWLPAAATQDELFALVARLNADDGVDGIFVQLPLPRGVDEPSVLAAVDPLKDVDGLHPVNAGELLLGGPGLVPATPLAIMTLLERHGVRLEGARALVIGRSRYAATPTALLLLAAHATVTVCDADAPGLPRVARSADVLVSAAGRPGLVTADLVQEGAAVLDAGLEGDVGEDVAQRAAFLAPVPGGVGPLTIAMLLRNTMRAGRYRRGVVTD